MIHMNTIKNGAIAILMMSSALIADAQVKYQPRVYPQQQTEVGVAHLQEADGEWTLSNELLSATFRKENGKLLFGGCEAMNLEAGTELFTISFGTGTTVVKASDMTMGEVTTESYSENPDAINGAKHFAGKAIKAQFTTTYGGARVTVDWKAVLRDGSHYLRTEMELHTDKDVKMSTITPMEYKINTTKAGSVPKVNGNTTRGAILLSDKIFAGLETPMGLNSVNGDASAAEPFSHYNAWTQDYFDWTPGDELPDGVKSVNTNLTAATVVGKRGWLKFGSDSDYRVTFQYTSGTHKLNICGVDIVDATGAVVASDYHLGYTGGKKANNIYTLKGVQAGTYMVRYFISLRDYDNMSQGETITSSGSITFSPSITVATAKEIEAVTGGGKPQVTIIKGQWLRDAKLKVNDPWEVSSVVGLVAEGQARRSFLAYSERERAVPWRCVPMYNSWYELNINRNNDRNYTSNMHIEDCVDVMKQWKEKMYDKRGVSIHSFVWDDGWDFYGPWTFSPNFPNGFSEVDAIAREMGCGIGAWLGPVGGYGASGQYRREYWTKKGEQMLLSNESYYDAFWKAAKMLVKDNGYDFRYFKFDGISDLGTAYGPKDGQHEAAEGIISMEHKIRTQLREDIFFNTTVGTWSSPMWFHYSDATWRQDADYYERGNNSNDRENWITYRDDMVHDIFVKGSPLCPINSMMFHGFILTEHGGGGELGNAGSTNRNYKNILNELRCAFGCGDGMVEVYADYRLMNSINGGRLWDDLADLIVWQKERADVLPDVHWVGGDPYNNGTQNIYGWAAWNGRKSILTLRNGTNGSKQFAFTLREVLDIPASQGGMMVLTCPWSDQAVLSGLQIGKQYNIDDRITVTLPGSSVFMFDGVNAEDFEEIKLTDIAFSEAETLKLEIGKTHSVSVIYTPENATNRALTWTSSDTNVATVQNGVITAVKVGECTITAKSNDGGHLTASILVKVSAPEGRVVDLSQLDNGKVYNIVCQRGFLLYDASQSQICGSNGKGFKAPAQSQTDVNQQFQIIQQNNKYYLYSCGAEKYVTAAGAYSDAPGTELTITQSHNSSYPWMFQLSGLYFNLQAANQTNTGLVINNWSTKDPGNQYYIEEVAAPSNTYTIRVVGTTDTSAGVEIAGVTYRDGQSFDLEKKPRTSDCKAIAISGLRGQAYLYQHTIYVSYEDAATKYYTMQNAGGGGYISLNPEYLSGGAMTVTNSNQPRDNKGLWAFEKVSNGKYHIYNYSTGKALLMGTVGDGENARTTVNPYDDNGYNTTYGGTFKFNGGNSNININGSTSWLNNRRGFLALWDGVGASQVAGDNGSIFYLREVDPAAYPDVFYAEYNTVEPGKRPVDISMHSLWYDTPAGKTGVSDTWMEYALPIGNGQVGATFRGGIKVDEIQLNEKTLWSGSPTHYGYNNHGYYQNMGSLFVEDESGDFSVGDETVPVLNYQRWLDIEKGMGGVRYAGADTQYERQYVASLPDRCIAAHYTVNGGKKLKLRFYFVPDGKINASKVTYAEGGAEYTSKPETVSSATRFQVISDGTIETTGAGVRVSDATYATVYVCAATNFDPTQTSRIRGTLAAVQTEVQNRIKAVAGKDFSTVCQAAVEKHQELMGKTALTLVSSPSELTTEELIKFYNKSDMNKKSDDGLFLEQLYWLYGRYLLVAANADLSVQGPSNLQGIWNDRSNSSFWHCDIHADVNVQMNYWPAEAGNLSDMHMPFLRWIMEMAKPGGNFASVADKIASATVGKGDVRGWTTTTETDMLGGLSSWAGNDLKTLGAWYITHLWQHYKYTLDKDFLREAFPVMLSGCQFLIDIAQKATDGTYEIPKEYSPEHGPSSENGTAFAQQLAREACYETIQAYEVLGTESGADENDMNELKEFYGKLDSGLRTETFTYQGSRVTLLREWKYTNQNTQSSWNNHRHLSHLMCLYPLNLVNAYATTAQDKVIYKAAVKSLELRGNTATGWSMGWKTNLWARALDGNHARQILSNALQHTTSYSIEMAGAGGCYYNLFDAHAPFQIDGNYGVSAGVNEMLLQSYNGITLLPALPTAWVSGSVRELKAEGNFTVSIDWEKNTPTLATIVSNKGAELRVRNGQGTKKIADVKVTVDGQEVTPVAQEDGSYQIPCQQGQTVVIDFTSAPTGIVAPTTSSSPESDSYNLAGQRVGENHKGVIVKKGSKVIRSTHQGF